MSAGARKTGAAGLPRVVVGGPSVLVGALLSILASGCAPTGDFGRPASSFLSDRALPFAGRIAAELRGEPAASLILTDDERALRRRAYAFLMPAHEGQAIEAVFADLARTRVLPQQSAAVEGYHHALFAARGESPAPLFARIAEDAQADRLLIPPFAALAARVIEADEARLQMLLHVTTLVEGEAREAAARVAENRCLVVWVREEARARAQRYRYALERLVIAAPQREAIDAERALAALDVEIGRLDALSVGTPEACRGFAEQAEPARVRAAPGPDGVIVAKP